MSTGGLIDDHISIGALIDLGALAVAVATSWATLKVTQKMLAEKIGEIRAAAEKERDRSEGQHEQNVERMTSIEIKIADQCLKKDDFKAFEQRFNEKMDRIDHIVGNAVARAAGMVIDAVKMKSIDR